MLLQMGVSIVILRLLTPEQMGIMAIPVVFSSLALVMVDSGFSQTLIRKAVPSEEDYKSVFVFNIAVSVLLYLLLVGAMPWIARFYGMPELVRIAPVLFLLVPLNALCVIQNTIFTRQFRFARLSKVVFTSSLVSGLVAIGMAWLSDWRPRAAFDAGRLRAMAPYSFRLLATDLISSVYNNVSQLFVGKLYAADVLGFFNQAQKLKELPVTSTMQAVQSVTFPALSKIADDERKFAESYRQVVMIVAFVMLPMMAGLIVVAPEMVDSLLGEKWMPMVPYFQVISLAGMFAPIATVSNNVLKVKSNGRIIVRLEVVKKVVMTLVLILTIPHSVLAVTWGLSAMAFFEMILNFGATTRYAGLTAGRFLRTLLPIASATAAMFGVVWAFGHFTSFAPLPTFLLKVAVGVVCYAGFGALFRLEAMRVAWELVKKLFR